MLGYSHIHEHTTTEKLTHLLSHTNTLYSYIFLHKYTFYKITQNEHTCTHMYMLTYICMLTNSLGQMNAHKYSLEYTNMHVI